MKKLITLLVLVIISTACMAQKSELKMANKAIAANNYTEALSNLSQLESTIDASKAKYQTLYYYLLGQANYANGTTPANFEKASVAFNKLFKLENKGSQKYSDDAKALVNAMIQKVVDGASKDYNKAVQLSKNESTKEQSLTTFINAGKGFEQVYALSLNDTALLQNAGLSYFFGNAYQKSLDAYNTLLDTGYTGISKTFSATNVLSNQKVYYASKSEMDRQVKLKLAKEPKIDIRESQRNEIIKMVAKNYIALKDNDKALEAILEAKKVAPNDYGLLVDEANIYYAMGDNLKFKEKLEEAVKINPTDPTLFYNIGVMKMELGDDTGAIGSFQKAIELNPNYSEAYNNIGAAILAKAAPIVEEMNKSLNDFDKYDRLQAKQFDVYKESLPYYEKAYELNNSNIGVVQTLLGIYENLEMNDKLKALKVAYEAMKK